jgi:hypothetical protein
VTIGTDGALTSLINEPLRIERNVSIGRFVYETFDGKDVDDCFFRYGRDLQKNGAWAECDFGKPGLRYESDVRRGIWNATADTLLQSGDTLSVFLHGDFRAAEEYGCPRELALVYRFLPETIELTFYWRGKDAIRSPEALWLQMDLSADNPNRWQLVKLGLPVSPLNVVSGGNRKLHTVEKLTCESALERLSVTPHDTPLLSVGGRHLYTVRDTFGDPAKGFWFLLCNNRWGTNFPQWYGGDLRAAFTISMRGLLPTVR